MPCRGAAPRGRLDTALYQLACVSSRRALSGVPWTVGVGRLLPGIQSWVEVMCHSATKGLSGE